MESSLPEETLEAYLKTDYYVFDDPPLLMKIGERSDDAIILMASLGTETAAFLTAWNPGSETLSDDENEDRQAELLTEIEHRRLNYLVGYGELGDWREYSYLVLGISKEEATRLGEQFDQNAFVWLDPRGIPELVCLR